MKNILVAQSGGPTSAINATLAGVVQRAQISGEVDKIYGAIHGIKGVLENHIVDIGSILFSPQQLERLCQTPSSALGSCRIKLPDSHQSEEEYQKIFQCFMEYDIGVFVYIGGNDSMDTVHKLNQYKNEHSIKGISIMGAPKTIDNDLCGMDHSPGFASAARYIATTFSELWCDCSVYDIPAVTIVEVMGRDVGWLTAASGMAAVYTDAPQLIYLPEVVFSEEKFLEDIRSKLEENPAVLVAVSEGIHHADGRLVSETDSVVEVDAFGHVMNAGCARVLEQLVKAEIGCKCRSIELNLMQRCAGHLASSVDIAESTMLGATALDRGLNGETGRVSVLRRIGQRPYQVEYDTVPVEEIANQVKPIPREWINEAGNFVTPDMIAYLSPLIYGDGDGKNRCGIPNHIRLY